MEEIKRIAWGPEYSLKVAELDRQHKELLVFFNEAVPKCSGDGTEEKKYFDSVKDAFVAALSTHFKTEEQFFAGRNYAHVLDHIKLMEKINFITHEIENGRWEMKLHILAMTLKNMCMYHFNTYDMNAKEYFTEESGARELRLQRAG